MFYVSIAVSDQDIFDEATGITRDALKFCLERIHLNVIEDDGLEPLSLDYTRCASYDRYCKFFFIFMVSKTFLITWKKIKPVEMSHFLK